MHCSLIRQQQLRTFDAKDEQQMLEHLELTDGHTIKQLISSAKDIELRPDGRLASNGYALTPLAFKQLCKYVAAGLYGLVADIGAVIGGSRSLDVCTSPELAVEIINKVVRLRFGAPNGIARRALILNAAAETVDGIVGARYKYVPSHQLYTSVKEMLDGNVTVGFERASLSGRRFAFTLRNIVHAHVCVNGEFICPVLYFTNSEAGEAGIHGCAGYLFEDVQLLARPHHVAHNNKDFESRLARLVNKVVLAEGGARRSFGHVASMLATPADFVVENKISKKDRDWWTKWIASYTGLGLAEEIVRKALFQGADGTEIPVKIAIEEVAKRTRRDLVLVTARAGQGQYHTIREACERAAFEMIV